MLSHADHTRNSFDFVWNRSLCGICEIKQSAIRKVFEEPQMACRQRVISNVEWVVVHALLLA